MDRQLLELVVGNMAWVQETSFDPCSILDDNNGMEVLVEHFLNKEVVKNNVLCDTSGDTSSLVQTSCWRKAPLRTRICICEHQPIVAKRLSQEVDVLVLPLITRGARTTHIFSDFPLTYSVRLRLFLTPEYA